MLQTLVSQVLTWMGSSSPNEQRPHLMLCCSSVPSSWQCERKLHTQVKCYMDGSVLHSPSVNIGGYKTQCAKAIAPKKTRRPAFVIIQTIKLDTKKVLWIIMAGHLLLITRGNSAKQAYFRMWEIMYFSITMIRNYPSELVTFCGTASYNETHSVSESKAKNSSSAFITKLLNDIGQFMELSSDFISLLVNGSVIILILPSSLNNCEDAKIKLMWKII